jgi:hypothetical protein
MQSSVSHPHVALGVDGDAMRHVESDTEDQKRLIENKHVTHLLLPNDRRNRPDALSTIMTVSLTMGPLS